MHQFNILKDQPEDQLNAILARNNLYSLLSPSDIANLPIVNTKNFVNICNFVDYYQFINEHKFIENIRLAILNKNKDVLDHMTELSNNMRIKICNHPCIPNTQCRDNNIKHVVCYKFLSQNNDISYDINNAIKDGNVELIEYFKYQSVKYYAIKIASEKGCN